MNILHGHTEHSKIPNSNAFLNVAFVCTIVLVQTVVVFGAQSIEWSAIILLIINLLIVKRHKNNFPILAFSLFNLPISLEPIITTLCDLSYYSLLVPSRLPQIMLMQTVSMVPLLIINPLPRIAPQAIFKGNALATLAIAICALLVHFGINGNVVLGSYQTYRENLSSGSGLIEYILMAMTMIATIKQNKLNKFLFLMLICFYILKCILLGFRVQATMAALLLSFFYFQALSPKKYIIIAVMGGLAGLTLGVIKHTLDFDATDLVLNGDYIQTPHDGAITSSTIAVNLLTPSLLAAISTPIAMLIPRVIVADLVPSAYPMFLIQTKTITPGGILYGTYGYLNFGLLGPLVVGLMIAIIASRLRSPKNNIQNINYYAAIAFFVFTPRWVLYDFGSYGVRAFVTTFILIFLLAILGGKISNKYYEK